MQLDLFLHSQDVMLRNDAIAALVGRDARGAGAAMHALAAACPHDPLLSPLATLVQALDEPPASFSNHEGALAAVARMQAEIAPAARAVFGGDEAAAWLRGHWAALAPAAAALTFDPAKEHAHTAYMLLQAREWAQAEASVATIASWRRIPAPLAWAAEARCAEGGVDGAFCLLAELAWIDPRRFQALAQRLDSAFFTRLLSSFEGGFECDGECEFAWFPAWAVIQQPGLAAKLREAQPCNGRAPERAARLAMSLLALERQGRHAELVRERKRLRELHAGLFAHYMATR